MKVLSGKESISSRSPSIKTDNTDTTINTHGNPLMDILLTLQLHINKNMSIINQNQKRLLQRIKHVDDLSLKTTQTIGVALNQSRIVSDRLNEAKYIKSQAKETRQYATNIFESLCRIQKLLEPEDCVGHTEFGQRWPILHSLHQRASNNGNSRSILHSSSSNNQHQQQKGAAASATITRAHVSSSSSSNEPSTTAPLSSSSSSSSIALVSTVSSADTTTSYCNQKEAQQSNLDISTVVMNQLRNLVDYGGINEHGGMENSTGDTESVQPVVNTDDTLSST
ncbi:uncharacterized protein BX664DRAFT_138541 [Halteromyces radiatus]|uniref:uncharacterized protein n=1 Tax=Halteromyces radiatus TaxID=101107 RepID=UPI0022205635|nr:uncharacterized protein BX664DRAFT_138541 [Halteromyces radiatus]KAI8089634.1 hypothetical protein BX664DRAFT_138541 [Halteromyces radiatus]